MIDATLVYADGREWFAGGFASKAAFDGWLSREQSRSYWDKTTTVRLVERIDVIDAGDAQKQVSNAMMRSELQKADFKAVKAVEELASLVEKLAHCLGVK